ncbi:hypothetical protein HB779_12225 [Phyllobacterium sp. 628]|uniref:hypothetical protein n=1 Tax=Phyllobacterium sp. 628 TaxID=2718938 RepID=UPI00166268F2|nr:hypothetical protein [Phyllobacterium sp. 628]QND52584.1 hypothetical protein HB779_12225 [Phyllobacterium sp. 628]
MKSIYLSTAFMLVLQTASYAQPIDSYTARLSSTDHFNSNGQRLDSAAAIIRQDRANYYVYGERDSEDAGDSFFRSKENRARLESMLNHGNFTQGTRRAIINGTPLIHVDIYEDYIEVAVESD